MNVTRTGIDVRCRVTLHITTASTNVLNSAVHCDIPACSSQVLHITVYLDAYNIVVLIFSSDGVPIDGLSVGIPTSINLLDGFTLDGICLTATFDIDGTALDDSTLSCRNRTCACTMNDRLATSKVILDIEATMTLSASKGSMIPKDILLVLNNLIDYIDNAFGIAFAVYYITVYIGYAEYFKHFFG